MVWRSRLGRVKGRFVSSRDCTPFVVSLALSQCGPSAGSPGVGEEVRGAGAGVCVAGGC